MHSQCEANEKKNGRGGEFSPAASSRLSMEDGSASEKPDPIKEFRASLKSVTEALTDFGQARVEAIRVNTQNLLLKVVLGVVGGIAGLVFLIVSIVLLLEGLAGAVSRLFNTGPWVGYLIVGAVCVGVPMTVMLVKIKKIKKQMLESLREKYAGRSEIQCQK